MDMQQFLENAVAASRAKTLANSDQLTLGEMILKLEPIVEKNKGKEDKDQPTVCYDFGYMHPTEIDSWRGAYAELALNYTEEKSEMKVADFLTLLKDAIGKEYIGYKGGEYIMSKRTPVWVANYGNSGNTAVVDIVDDGWRIIIITGLREY